MGLASRGSILMVGPLVSDPDGDEVSVTVEVDGEPVAPSDRLDQTASEHLYCWRALSVSYIRTATTIPDMAVSAATSQTAARRPSASAVTPAMSAPAA